MFSIYDGRNSFFQWDLDRKLVVEDNTIKEVHFCNKTDTCALVVETYTEDGLTLANVPNIILQNDFKVYVYGYDENYTKYQKCFEVMKRNKPADYVYTETEVLTWEQLEVEVRQGIEETKALLGDIDTALEEIIELQEKYIKDNAADIKFYITGNEYTVKEFSTWKDYFSIQENIDNVGYFDYGDGLVRIYGGVFWLLYNDGTTVQQTDEIIVNYDYQITNEYA